MAAILECIFLWDASVGRTFGLHQAARYDIIIRI